MIKATNQNHQNHLTYPIKAENAIILAAGFGNRLLPLTIHTPKSLIVIQGLPIIEHQIQYLKEAGINTIYVVVGYLKEKFLYLTKKYEDLYLIENQEYQHKNNISSLKVALSVLGNSYLIEGDIFLKKNIFSLRHFQSSIGCLFSKEKSQEWGMILDEKNKVKKIDFVAENQPFLVGISFWTKEDASKMKIYIEQVWNNKNHESMFWEEATYLNRLDQFDVKANFLDKTVVKEIDTLDELVQVDSAYKNFQKIKEINLNVTNENVNKIKTVITNNSYLIKNQDKDCIIRFPRNNSVIDRKMEFENINLITPLNISEKVLFFDVGTGIKISEKLKGEVLEIREIPNKIEKLAGLLKKLHTINGNIDTKSFFPFKRLENYFDKNVSFLSKDYHRIKEELIAYYNKYLTIDYTCFCHCDLVPENFIVDEEKLFLIDWEYAEIHDPHLDIASLFDECNFDIEQQRKFLNLYGANFSAALLEKIKFWRVYINLTWSIWCYFFENEQDFDHYRLFRLQKAKTLLGELK